MVKGCVSAVLVYATLDHAYLDSIAHASLHYTSLGGRGGSDAGLSTSSPFVVEWWELEEEGEPVVVFVVVASGGGSASYVGRSEEDC